MRKIPRSVMYTSGSFLIAVFIIFSLYAIANKTVEHKNNFNRVFHSLDILDSMKIMDTKLKSLYVSGLTEKNIYLSNFFSPNDLLITNYSLSDSQHVKLKIPSGEKLAWRALKIRIDYPNVFVIEGITPKVLVGDLSSLKYTQPRLDKKSFSKAIPIATNSLVFRAYDSTITQNVLVKAKTSMPSQKNTFVLEKQVDGFFCTDGMLLHNYDLGRIIYVYYYRNQFTVLDTSLNLLYKGNTIDTISRAIIKTGAISSENRTVLISRPQMVNKRSTTHDNRLFINSGVISDNEQKQMFDQNYVIDIYSLDNYKYQSSFYLPKYFKEKLHDFRVYKNKVIALYGQYLVTYNIQL